ncbi:hypothetical protein BBF96_02410 [Anoxybacter fermentans]|uniref:Uncharacterized protein n=1 Tax=Anoxybacter fermentans TaxID=1323375 RepID=A0A3Q9HP49_9FIRM|nr:hypothetical protein [Anoxybacter fermentans]AZR72343.1 hypothetical protein BBF96_02410 [Anoxybacter fermentans]
MREFYFWGYGFATGLFGGVVITGLLGNGKYSIILGGICLVIITLIQLYRIGKKIKALRQML